MFDPIFCAAVSRLISTMNPIPSVVPVTRGLCELQGSGLSELVPWIVDSLRHPAVGNLFLLIASVIGVVGSYLLYITRRGDRREKLKRALAFEISEMDQLAQASDTLEGLSNPPPQSRLSASKVPPAEAFPTTVYESNTSDLGLMSDDELESVVDFYTSVIQYKGIIDGLRADPDETPMPDHEMIVTAIPEIAEQRNEVLRKLGYGNLVDE